MAFPIVRNIRHVDVNSPVCPQDLRLVLREQFRDLFKRRQASVSWVLSNRGLDAIIDKWWSNHRTMIMAASLRPEWDWKTLSLIFDENVSRPVNFYVALKDFLTLLGRPYYLDRSHWSVWNFSKTSVVDAQASSERYLGTFHTILYSIFYEAFAYVVLEGKEITEDTTYTDADARLSPSIVQAVKELIDSKTTEDKRGAFCTGGIQEILGKTAEEFVPFNKLPKAIFDKIHSIKDNEDAYARFIRNLEVYFSDHRSDFFVDLYKAIGAHQMAGDNGPVKTTLTNKLVKSFNDWLTALSYGFRGNPWPVSEDLALTFEQTVDIMKSLVFYTDNPLKIRVDGTDGFQYVERGTFEQIFARLQENVKGSFTKESFIVSFHPCDMITCSLGYNWSSCQSWIDNFQDLPDGYGRGSHYGGQFNRGNFQFLCGNGFIAYIPHERMPGVPQYLWAKKKRCLLWVGNNLDCMRQNDFYPGHPKDPESLALAKVIREYLQDVFAPFNFSNGTMDWKVKKDVGKTYASNVEDTDFVRFEERYDCVPGRYDDPIMALSYLKSAVKNDDPLNKSVPFLYYALTFPRLDTGLPSNTHSNWATSFVSNTHGVCPICGKHTTRGGICVNCQKEMIEHNGVKVHPSDLVTINVNGKIKRFDINELDKLDDYVTTDDGVTIEFKSAYKVFMPSGIKYFKELPPYVKQCKVCKEYFHQSFMIGDVCIEHFNTALANSSSDDIVIDINEVLKAFLAGTLSFDCNDTDNLLALLRLLDTHHVKWVSGVNASAYVPRTNSAKRMFLSLNNGKLILSSQAKSTVIKLSNLFKKGGE